MNIGEIMAFNKRKVFFLYHHDYGTSVRAWQILFNVDGDLIMKKDRITVYRFSYEGVNNFGDHVFDEIPIVKKGYCCFGKSTKSRYRILFTKRGMELVATHTDKTNGYRTQYVVDV